MTEQVQNPTRLRSPRIPAITDRMVTEGGMVRAYRKAYRGGKTTNEPRRRSAAGLTHPKVVVTGAGYEQRTPHGMKELRARRAKNRVAKQSRKVNRRYRATGGLR